MQTEMRIYKFVQQANWAVFALASLVCLLVAPRPVFWGVALGGFIVTVNFTLLSRTLKNSLTPGSRLGVGSVLGKYYLRFTATAIIVGFLIAFRLVNPVGLLGGLSTVVVSIFFALLWELTVNARKRDELTSRADS